MQNCNRNPAFCTAVASNCLLQEECECRRNRVMGCHCLTLSHCMSCKTECTVTLALSPAHKNTCSGVHLASVCLADGQLFIKIWNHWVPTVEQIWPYEASIEHNKSLPSIVSVNGNTLLLSDVMLAPDFDTLLLWLHSPYHSAWCSNSELVTQLLLVWTIQHGYHKDLPLV